MAENQPDLEVQDDSIETPVEDKTSKNESNTLDDLPSEDEDLGGAKNPGEKPTQSVDKSEIAQKIKWREKARNLESDVKRLSEELERSKERVQEKGGAIDDKEKAAQQYIRDQAKKAYEEMRSLEKEEEARTLREFESKIESVLEDNPELTKEELLGFVEKYKVELEMAAEILLETKEKSKSKPKMPQSRRGSPEVKKSETPKSEPGQRKNLWQIAQDVKKDLKNLKF